jgi:putative restriction endonuclease
VRIVVGVTDNRWASFLRDRRDLTEANFWQPSPHGFKALSAGEPFLFKTKDPRKYRNVDIPGYALVGGGFFDEYVELRVSEAWMIWGAANGVADEAELMTRALSYRARDNQVDPDPTIGCIILRNLFFAERGHELPEPPGWARNNVTYTGYNLERPDLRSDTEYVQHAFAGLQQSARIDLAWEPDLRGIALDWQGPRYGPPTLVRPRMGQGHFKRAVGAAYRHRCAVTGSATYPSLEAAHFRPFADGGEHAVSNGLLLRTDVHRLYDRGYISIDPDLRLRVSPQLRAHGWNGIEFYQREEAGFRVSEPDDPEQQPDRDALTWHLETTFRAG